MRNPHPIQRIYRLQPDVATSEAVESQYLKRADEVFRTGDGLTKEPQLEQERALWSEVRGAAERRAEDKWPRSILGPELRALFPSRLEQPCISA